MSTIDRELVKSYLTLRTGRSFEVIYHLHAEPVRRSMTRSLGGFCSSEVDEFLQEFWAKLPELLERWDPRAWQPAHLSRGAGRLGRAQRRGQAPPPPGASPGERAAELWSRSWRVAVYVGLVPGARRRP
jgi:hypothetical protein